MKKNTTSAGPHLVALAMLAATLLASGTSAQAGKTHMNQTPEYHVTLVSVLQSGLDVCNGGWLNYGLFEVGPDGQPDATPFVVADGYRLIVTDLSWSVIPPPTNIAADNFEVLQIRPSGLGTQFVYRYATIVEAAMAAANIWYGQDHLTTGFSIGAGLTLCPTAYRTQYGSAATNSVNSLTVHGYLIRSK